MDTTIISIEQANITMVTHTVLSVQKEVIKAEKRSNLVSIKNLPDLNLDWKSFKEHKKKVSKYKRFH